MRQEGGVEAAVDPATTTQAGGRLTGQARDVAASPGHAGQIGVCYVEIWGTHIQKLHGFPAHARQIGGRQINMLEPHAAAQIAVRQVGSHQVQTSVGGATPDVQAIQIRARQIHLPRLRFRQIGLDRQQPVAKRHDRRLQTRC